MTVSRHTKVYTAVAGIALVGAGAVGGAVLAMRPAAGASTATKLSASTSTESGVPTHHWPGGGAPGALDHFGTVTAVGKSTVTIRTSAGTTTYTVGSGSDIDKNGETALSALKPGDVVVFSTTTSTSKTIARLHAGPASFDFRRGGRAGPRFGAPGRFALDLSGTVTAVGKSTVTIRTSAGTTTYTVGSGSDIDKNGEASLSALKPGDAVVFSTTTSTSKTIAILHAGKASLDSPRGGPGWGRPGDGPGGPPWNATGSGTSFST